MFNVIFIPINRFNLLTPVCASAQVKNLYHGLDSSYKESLTANLAESNLLVIINSDKTSKNL